MIRFVAIVCAVVLLGAASSLLATEPDGVVIGFDSTDGQLLLSELSCVSCHQADQLSFSLPPKQAPLLNEVGSRVTPQYLRDFLRDPHATKPGTSMPDALHGLSQKEREQTVEQLTHYLASLGEPIDQRSSGSSKAEIDRGAFLFHTVGCVACHAPQEPPRLELLEAATAGSDLPATDDEEEAIVNKQDDARIDIPYPNLAKKTTVDALAKFLGEPHAVRPSGRMPSLSLSPSEARAIAAYLLREQYTPDKTASGVGVGFEVFEGKFAKLADIDLKQPTFKGRLDEIDLTKALAVYQKATGNELKNNFAVRFYGSIAIPEAGEYLFETRSDDGSMIRIAGENIVDNDGQHPPKDARGSVELREGNHEFELLFFQAGGPFELSAKWQPPGGKKEAIPAGIMRIGAAAMIPQDIVDFEMESG